MKRTIFLLCAVILFSGLLVAPAAAGEKLEVEILGAMDLSGTGAFEVQGEAAGFLCESGMLESANTRIVWLADDTFKIWQDKVLTCDGTAQVMVLELKATIVIGQGMIPGKGTWKLKDSTGFDPAPKGKGEIVFVGSTPDELREAYVGLLGFK
jgi:hypothetical protein